MNGRELRAWRSEQYLSQQELAAIIGVHYTTVANWEHGRALPPGELLELACEAISGRRERQVRALRAAQEKLSHWRRLKAIRQGLPERKAAAAADSVTPAQTVGAHKRGEV